MVIYRALFPNEKSYIGKSVNFNSRKLSHLYSSKYKSANTKMKYAILKYGFDSISWEILEETDNLEKLNNLEKEYIKKFDSINNGYNISSGGDGGDTISNNPNKNDIIKRQLSTKGFDPKNYILIEYKIANSIKEDYLDNKFSIKALCRKYNISKNRMTRFLKSSGIEIDKDRCKLTNSVMISDEKINIFISKFKNNKTIKGIAEEERLTIMIVSRILHDSGIRKSSRFENGRRYDGKQPKK